MDDRRRGASPSRRKWPDRGGRKRSERRIERSLEFWGPGKNAACEEIHHIRHPLIGSGKGAGHRHAEAQVILDPLPDAINDVLHMLPPGKNPIAQIGYQIASP